MLTLVHDNDIYTDGYNQGQTDGYNQGQTEVIYELVQDGLLAIDVAAIKLNLTIDSFKASMTEAGYKLPTDN